jgi:hypothetical protein
MNGFGYQVSAWANRANVWQLALQMGVGSRAPLAQGDVLGCCWLLAVSLEDFPVPWNLAPLEQAGGYLVSPNIG